MEKYIYSGKINTMPNIIGVRDNYIIGSDKLIFCTHNNHTKNNVNFIVITYPEHFNYVNEQIINEKLMNHDAVPWYDNYYFTYKEKEYSNVVKIYEKINTKNVEVNSIDCNSEFQFGDRSTIKNTLDNGDIIFENYGDVSSTVIFTKNDPKIKCYSAKLSEKIMRYLDIILYGDDYGSYDTSNINIDWTNDKECNAFYEKLDAIVKKTLNKMKDINYYNKIINDIFDEIKDA